MKPTTLRIITKNHEAYWDSMSKELWKYKQVYEGNFWADSDIDDTQLQIQTSDGYSYVEAYQASLFAKNPAIVLKPGIRDKGDVKVSEPIANAFFVKARKQVKDASRLALIYPNAYLKLIPCESESLYGKLLPVALSPWEVIVDTDAARWDEQRYIGHIYWMPIAMAEKKFGSKDYKTQCKELYFDSTKENPNTASELDSDPLFQYIKVVEMYDFEDEKLYFWSPNFDDGKTWLEETVLPFRNLDNEPFAPIGPFMYTSLPDFPLLGYSAMKRVYDQLYELNIIRSFQANAVRKASRQWLVRKDRVDAESMNQVTSGIDGLFIPVETEGNESLSDIIHAIPHTSTPVEVDKYYNSVKQDKDNGTNLAPFTRGEATKATATEIAALAAYTSSEVGVLARERDAAIEYLAYLYLNMLAMYVEDEKDSIVVKLDGKLVPVTAESLRGDYEVYAADSAATPLSELFQKQEFLQNIGVLQELGVPTALIREELLKRLNLPEDWNTEAQAEEDAALQAAQAAPNQMPPTSLDLVGNPSAANVAQVLPGMAGV